MTEISIRSSLETKDQTLIRELVAFVVTRAEVSVPHTGHGGCASVSLLLLRVPALSSRSLPEP